MKKSPAFVQPMYLSPMTKQTYYTGDQPYLSVGWNPIIKMIIETPAYV